MIHFKCPGCQLQFDVDDALAEQKGQCSNCETKFIIPVANDTDNIVIVTKNSDEPLVYENDLSDTDASATSSSIQSKAAEWFRKAAEQGHVKAQYHLGLCYKEGTGVPKDEECAEKWLRKAAQQGDTDAQGLLDGNYENNYRVEHTAQIIEKSNDLIHHGIPIKQEKLEQSYSTSKNITIAHLYKFKFIYLSIFCVLCFYCIFAWLLVTNDKPSVSSQSTPSIIKSYNAATIKWLRIAAEEGDTKAQLELANCYECGLGVEKDEAEAVKWHRKATGQGDTQKTNKPTYPVKLENSSVDPKIITKTPYSGLTDSLLAEAANFHSAEEIDECRQQINKMAQEIKIRIGNKDSETAIQVLNSYIFDEQKFQYDTLSKNNNIALFLLPSVIKFKKGDCVGLTTLYLCLGEKLGLPLRGILAPMHMFLRLDLGKTYQNIDPGNKGIKHNDSEYINKVSSPEFVGKSWFR